MSQLKPTTSSVYITMPLGGQLDIWTIMLSFSSRKKKLDFMYPEACALQHYWTHLEEKEVIASEIKQRHNAARIFIAARANRNRLSQWRRSIHRAGLSWSVSGGEHTPAVSVGKEKKIAFITEGRGLSGRREAETESVIHFQINPRG